MSQSGSTKCCLPTSLTALAGARGSSHHSLPQFLTNILTSACLLALWQINPSLCANCLGSCQDLRVHEPP